MIDENYKPYKVSVSFDPVLAKQNGIRSAVILEFIESFTEEMGDSSGWATLSINSIQERFPYWNKQQIRKEVSNLQDIGYIETKRTTNPKELHLRNLVAILNNS
jgi:hypothetical protein